MNENVETLIRSFAIPQLQVLSMLANSKDGISSNQEISSTTQTAIMRLGSLLTPLRRKKVSGESLIIQAGKDPEKGTRWQINEKLTSLDDLKILLISMKIPEF